MQRAVTLFMNRVMLKRPVAIDFRVANLFMQTPLAFNGMPGSAGTWCMVGGGVVDP